MEAPIEGLEYGPLAVGFATLEEYDHVRTFRVKQDENGQMREYSRPMLISVWYPAHSVDGARRMRFGDYVDVTGNIESFEPLTAERRSDVRKSFATRDSAVDERLEALLAMQTFAVRDAPRRTGTYPLLLYSPGGVGPPHENAILFEYLASHGYIIAHIPSYASRTYTKGDVGWDLAGVEAGTRDLEFMYSVMRAHPGADPSRLAILDFSWGGLAAATFTSRNHDVDVAVSFDGGPGLRDLLGGLDNHPQFAPDRMRVPFLHFVSRPFWSGDRYRSDYHGRVPHSDVFVLKFDRLTHSQMASGPLLAEMHAADVADAERVIRDREYSAVARYTLAFLDAYLRGEAHGMQILERGLAGDDPELVGIVMTRAGSRSRSP